MCLRSQRGPAPIVQRPRTPAFHAGNTGSNPVGGTKDGTTPDVPPWSCGAVWSARRPVKPEVAGSNPVRTANLTGSSEQVRRGRVAQLEEHSPEKRGVPGSTPGPTTAEGPPPGRAFRRFSPGPGQLQQPAPGWHHHCLPTIIGVPPDGPPGEEADHEDGWR